MRNWNQVRPGVFDGGYAFSEYDAGPLCGASRSVRPRWHKIQAFYTSVRTGARAAKLPEAWLLPSDYIVEATTPPGYKALREHHKNVDFGDAWAAGARGPAPGVRGSGPAGAAAVRHRYQRRQRSSVQLGPRLIDPSGRCGSLRRYSQNPSATRRRCR